VQTLFVTESIKHGHLLDLNDLLLSDHVISETQTSDTVVDAAPSIPAREHSGTASGCAVEEWIEVHSCRNDIHMGPESPYHN
jgi:hypothetical protein